MTTADGRLFVRDQDEADDELAWWKPEPIREGDFVYCCGQKIGVFNGDPSIPGGWYIQVAPTAELPAKMAERLRSPRKGSTHGDNSVPPPPDDFS